MIPFVSDDGSIVLNEVPIVTPNGDTVVKSMSIHVRLLIVISLDESLPAFRYQTEAPVKSSINVLIHSEQQKLVVLLAAIERAAILHNDDM